MSNYMAVSIDGMQSNDSPPMSTQTEQAKAFLTRHGVQITEKVAASLRSKPLSSGKLRQAAIIHIDA